MKFRTKTSKPNPRRMIRPFITPITSKIPIFRMTRGQKVISHLQKVILVHLPMSIVDTNRQLKRHLPGMELPLVCCRRRVAESLLTPLPVVEDLDVLCDLLIASSLVLWRQ